VAVAATIAGPALAQIGGAGTFAETDWKARTVEEVTLQAPFDFGPAVDLRDKLPDGIKGLVVQMALYNGAGNSDRLTLAISRTVYRADVTVNLDGAVTGALKSAMAALGEANPQYTTRELKVGDLPARAARSRTQRDGKTMNYEILVVGTGARMWQVQVFYDDAANAPAAARVLDSLRINNPAAPR